MVNAGEQTRASDLRRLARAKEAEIVTLDRLAEAVRDRLIALRLPVVLSGEPTPIDGRTGGHGICAADLAHRIDAVFSQGAVGLSNSCVWYPLP